MLGTDGLMYNTPTMKNQLYFESREWQTQVPIIFILSFCGKILLSKNHQKIWVDSEQGTGLCRAQSCTREGNCSPGEGGNVPRLVSSTGGGREITIHNF